MTLTDDQQIALAKIITFIYSDATEFCLIGSSGAGKSFVTRYIADNIKIEMDKRSLIAGEIEPLQIELTATTNEAATVLSDFCGKEAKTIFKLFGLSLIRSYETGKTTLNTKRIQAQFNKILCIDEASMLTKQVREAMLSAINNKTKIIYILDSKQLDAIGDAANVTTLGFPYAELTTNIRQGGNEIESFGAMFKDCVGTGKLPTLSYENSEHIKYINGSEFEELVSAQFSNTSMTSNDAKIACYTNARVAEYNKHILDLNGRTTGFHVGDIVTSRNSILEQQKVIIRTNALVEVTSEPEAGEMADMTGYFISIKGVNSKNKARGFIPNDPNELKRVMKKLAKEKKWKEFFSLEDSIFNLVPKYAGTVFVMQGGTLNTVFIDLEDIYSCYDKDTIARMMYVAITRASNKVYLYGRV